MVSVGECAHAQEGWFLKNEDKRAERVLRYNLPQLLVISYLSRHEDTHNEEINPLGVK